MLGDMSATQEQLMEELHRWTTRVSAELEIAPEVLAASTTPVLDVVRDIAHGVNRPSAPLTAFLIGLSAGRVSAGLSDEELTASIVSRVAAVQELAGGWQPADGSTTQD